MISAISGTDRLIGLDEPPVCSIVGPPSEEKDEINLGQSFYRWDPPQFYQKYLEEAQFYSTHQYTKAFGSPNYTKAIAHYHEKSYQGHNLKNKIIAVNGGSEALYCCIMGLVNEGQEVVIFDPACDLYRAHVQMAGGKTIAIKLRPKKRHTKAEIIERFDKSPIMACEEDEWQFDWSEFESAFNQKTKILIINNPHNPVGKVFTHEQMSKITEVLIKHPQVAVIEDNVYEGMTFDHLNGKPLPKITNFEGMFDRTLSVYSGGKILQSTGIKCGWIIGPEYLIKYPAAIFQVTCFSQYNVLENAVAKSLEYIVGPQSEYMVKLAQDMAAKRNLLIIKLINSSFDFDLWVPSGGNFIIVDISRVEIKEKYTIAQSGSKFPIDLAFSRQLAIQNGIICVPCSRFFDKNNAQQSSRYVRFSFCQKLEVLQQVGVRLS